jgi:hypothetical protein
MDLLIVVPPFTSVDFPSVLASVALSAARAAGLNADVLYLSRLYADLIGEDAYLDVARMQRSLGIGEWVGAGLLWDTTPPSERFANHPEHNRERLASLTGLDCAKIESLEELRCATTQFTADAAKLILSRNPAGVLFCCSHQQLSFSLSTVRQLKSAVPSPLAGLFGTLVDSVTIANTLLSAYSELDVVVCGDAGTALLQGGMSIFSGNVPGVVRRDTTYQPIGHRVRDSIALPLIYSDNYLSVGLDPIETVLPWRASVGCDWGDRSRCTFCALLPTGHHYAAKAAPTAITELRQLVDETECLDVVAADLLMPKHYPETFFASDDVSNLDLSFFFDVKSDLRKHQIAAMSRGA